MSSRKAIEALRQYRAAVSQRKQQDVLQALEDLLHQGRRITVTDISRQAGVSREFLYANRSLLEAVTAAKNQTPKPHSAASNDGGSYSSDGFQAERVTLLANIKRLRAQVASQQEQLAEYENRRKRWLGSQLLNEAFDPEVNVELHVTINRLMSEKTSLLDQIDKLRRLNATLESDLEASRQSHQETMREAGLLRGLPKM